MPPPPTIAARSPRPRDAATLVLVRHRGGRAEVLMGQRRTRDAWSKLYVFPGGRVDRRDARVPTAGSLRPEVEGRLLQACTPARARALAVAAIRETWEETGLALVDPIAAPPRVPGDWQGLLDRGLAPSVQRLHLLCRAITPPRRPRRFNARFFLADAADARGELRGNGELHDLHWIGVDEALSLDIPLITRAVLGELAERLRGPSGLATPRRIPLFKTVHGQHRRLEE